MKSMNVKGFSEIDVWRILSVLWKKKILIAIVAVVSAIAAGIGSGFMVTPMYQADILVYVNSGTISFSGLNITTSDTKTMDTYFVIMKSRSFLKDMIEKTGLPYSANQLKGMFSASSVNGTSFFTVTATSSDPEEARIIADAVGDALAGTLSNIIKGSSVTVVDRAVRPTGSISRGRSSYALYGFVGGLAVMCGILALLEILNDKVHGEDTLSELCPSIPILAYIPHQGSERKYSYYSRYSRYGYGRYGKYGYGGYGHGYGYKHAAQDAKKAAKEDNEGKKA